MLVSLVRYRLVQGRVYFNDFLSPPFEKPFEFAPEQMSSEEQASFNVENRSSIATLFLEDHSAPTIIGD